MRTFQFFLLVAIIQFFAGCKQNQSEIYLLPDGFKGKVNIVFNQIKGVPSKYEDGKRVYEISNNGILLTRLKDEYRIVNHEYFYVDSLNKRVPLRLFNDSSFTDSSMSNIDEIGIFYDGTTGVYGNSDDRSALNYQQFFVSDYRNLDSFFRMDIKKKFDEDLSQAIGRPL